MDLRRLPVLLSALWPGAFSASLCEYQEVHEDFATLCGSLIGVKACGEALEGRGEGPNISTKLPAKIVLIDFDT